MTTPIDLRPIHAKIVQDIIARYLPSGVSVRVFGSRAKWTAKPHSDLDLAVKGEGPISRAVLGDMAEAFSESDLPFRVDVVDWYLVAPSFQTVIDRDGAALPLPSFPVATLGELAAKDRYSITIGPFGSKMKADTYVETGVPVIRGTNIGSGRSLKGDWVYIPQPLADTMPNCLLQEGDLVFPHRGAIGEIALIDDDHSPIFLSSSMMKFRPDQEKLLSRFAYYYFRSERGRQEILRFASSVGTPGIGQPLTSLRQFSIPLPDINEQAAIADVISALDDKIELNRQMNRTLERQAQAIFRDWFVDFGPVRRKQAGEADPVAIMGGLTPDPTHATHLAALFPHAFCDDGLPVGWAMTPFSSVVTIIGGGTPKTSIATYWDGDIPWFSVADTPAGADTFVLDTEKRITRAGLENSSARMIPAGTTIITARGTVGNLAVAGREMTFNQSCYALRSADGEHPYFVYLATSRAIEQLQSMAHGSVFSTITRQTFDSVPIAKAGYEMIEMFERIVAPLFERIKASVVENRTLAETRDDLLPRLMSGTVRVVPQDRAA